MKKKMAQGWCPIVNESILSNVFLDVDKLRGD